MSEFKSQYDRQKHCAKNAHYYELSHFFAITDNSSHPHGQELFFIEKLPRIHFFAITDNSSHPHGQELFFIEKLPRI